MVTIMVDFISKEFTYAIVGASNNPEKYGYKVLKELNDNGYKAIPVNPKEKKILGLKAFKSISEVESIDMVVFIVPPKVTMDVLQECLAKGINKVWLQPESESKEAFDFCAKNKIKFFFGCMLMEKK